MATLYVAEQGARLVKEQRRLRVEREGETLLEVPAFKVDRVLVFGNVQLTTPAVGFLLENGIETAFLTVHGVLKGRLAAVESKNVFLRVKQSARAQDEAFALELARRIVLGKVENQRRVIQRHARNHPDAGPFDGEVRELERLTRRIAGQAHRSDLMGLEGQASATYFRAFGRMLRAGMTFSGRSRRPPKDPPNALLGLGYTLLMNEVLSVLTARGFDPYIGFYHGIRYGRPSLALDLMEEFRPAIVDRLTLTLLNRQVLQAEHFEAVEAESGGRPETRGDVQGDGEGASARGSGGVRLTADGRRRFFTQYEERMQVTFEDPRTNERVSYRRLLDLQAGCLSRAIAEGKPYDPFLLE